ncbi:MAG: epimerase transport system membrane fusion protein [Gammaproteobacteria bacterium]|jgi:epimerase transport system membrane fusion protein
MQVASHRFVPLTKIPEIEEKLQAVTDEIQADKALSTGGAPTLSFADPVVPVHPKLHPFANVRKVIQAGMIIIFLVFGGFGTWGVVAKLSSAVLGTGVVKVDLNRKTIQHLEGGIIKEILVRDGDHVEAGQVLIVIDDARVTASVELLQGQLDAELAKSARLTAERDEQAEIVFSTELLERSVLPEVAELIQAENNYFNTKRRILFDQIVLIKNKIEEIKAEIKGLKTQLDANDRSIVLLKEEIVANESLENSKYVQKSQIRLLKRTVEDYHARIGDTHSDIARAHQKISDMELRIVSLRDEYVQTAASELTGRQAAGVQAKIFDLQARLRPSLDAQRRQQIVAPIAGTVVGLQVFTIGGVINPRQALLDIVPDNNPLIVEAKVGVESINSVHAGLDADIRLTAYKSRSTKLVRGKVTYVSADRLTDERSQEAYYLVHIDVDRQSLADAGDLLLLPGMAADIFIRTGERTAFDIMMSPLTASMGRAFRSE